MTTSGAICVFPFKLANNSENNGCYWNSEHENFMCPTSIADDGSITTQGICNNDCPLECEEKLWKCGEKCIPINKSCMEDYYQGIFDFEKKHNSNGFDPI
jgi:hypothetical protein